MENSCMHEGAHLLALCGCGGAMVGTWGCPVCREEWERRLSKDEFHKLLGKAKLIMGDIREGSLN